MKTNFLYLFMLAFFFASCEEEPLPIVTEAPIPPLLDTTFVTTPASTPQSKIVLFEDYTGVRCVPCPTGHAALTAIIDKYPDNVIGIAVHPGRTAFPQSFPYDDAQSGQPDLNTEWGAKLMAIITKPNGIPYGTADRVLKSNLVADWMGHADTRAALTTPVNVGVKVLNFDDATRTLRFEIEIEMTADLDEELLFSTAFTEDSIVTWQETSSGTDKNYVHNHVLRDMPNFSEKLNPNKVPALTSGRTFVKRYDYVLPKEWRADKLKLIAYVHRQIEVMQAAEIHIK